MIESNLGSTSVPHRTSRRPVDITSFGAVALLRIETNMGLYLVTVSQHGVVAGDRIKVRVDGTKSDGERMVLKQLTLHCNIGIDPDDELLKLSYCGQTVALPLLTS